jgi:hypothetical protein
MDLQLLNELHERNIAGTYMESKFFLNPGNAHTIDRRDLAEITFVALMGLFVLYQLPHTRRDASEYASNTMKWDMSGTFARHRIQATDLYISLQAMHDYEKSQIAGQLKPSTELNKVQVSSEHLDKAKQPVKRFLLDVMYMQLGAEELRFFFNLQTQMYITDPTIKALRREVGAWTSLTKSEKTYTLTRLALWLKRHAPKFDLNSVFTKALAARDIDVK